METMQHPIRILELRCADGPGGGPEKTIGLGAARSDQALFRVTLCYIRQADDTDKTIESRAKLLGLDYVEIRQRHGFDRAVVTEIRNLIRNRSVNIVHAHDYKTNLIALLIARLDGVIPLSTVHGWTGHLRRERFVYYPLDRRVLPRFPLAICVSDHIRRELVRFGARPSRLRTVHNGIDHMYFRRDEKRREAARADLGLTPGTLTVGAVGRLEPQKRFDIVIKAFAQTRQQYPHARLLIAGEGSLRAALEQQARELALGDTCAFLGHCQDVRAFYHALDVFVQSSDYEGTPNVVLEAMACEAPVVATDVGGTGELVRDGIHGLVVRPGCPDELAGAICQVLNDPSGARERVTRARARVESELSFDVRMRTVEGIYRELLEKFPDGYRRRRQLAGRRCVPWTCLQ